MGRGRRAAARKRIVQARLRADDPYEIATFLPTMVAPPRERPTMRVILIDETDSAVTITNRTLPQLLWAGFSLGAAAFFVWVLYNTLPGMLAGEGSWLPPLDRLPDIWKKAILLACLAAGLAIVLAPLVISFRTLRYGRVWRFDARKLAITRNGVLVGRFNEAQAILVEGDFRGDEPSSVELVLLKRDGKRMKIASGTLNEDQLRHFLAAAQSITRRTKIPYRKIGITPRSPRWRPPAWWEALS